MQIAYGSLWYFGDNSEITLCSKLTYNNPICRHTYHQRSGEKVISPLPLFHDGQDPPWGF